jgi:uncharacterized protein (DUF433 family)
VADPDIDVRHLDRNTVIIPKSLIRGMRIRVIDVLDLFAAGLSSEQIPEEMPDLETEDSKAALQYAARKLGHPVLAA